MLISCIVVIILYIYKCKKNHGHNLQAVANGAEINNATELNEMNV
jgi:hypothetical protein